MINVFQQVYTIIYGSYSCPFHQKLILQTYFRKRSNLCTDSPASHQNDLPSSPGAWNMRVTLGKFEIIRTILSLQIYVDCKLIGYKIDLMATIQEEIIQKFGSVAPPGMQAALNPFVEVITIHSFTDFLLANLYIGVFYYLTYFIFGGLLEYTNPAPKTPERVASTKLQVKMGIYSLFCLLLYTTVWLWKVDRLTPFYGYWAGRENEFDLGELVLQVFIYLFVFDTWFYFTHHLLHVEWFMKHVHRHHHQFMEPTAFAQDAVHPFESVLQGPMGHFLCTLVYPMNPLLISAIGFLTSIYALLAHDGRALDLNSHTYHHYYRECNFGLYWGFWDFVFGTRYNTKRFPTKYVPSWEIETKRKD